MSNAKFNTGCKCLGLLASKCDISHLLTWWGRLFKNGRMILSQLNQNFLDKNITKCCYPWCSAARASRARESSAINFYSHKNVYCCDISMLMVAQRFCFHCYARLSDFSLSWKKVTEWNKPYPPTLYRGTFDIKGEIKDTFLHMKDWTKGVAFINGHNLGRYWELGPQETLYLPAPWLRRGNNEVSFTEQFRLSYSEIRCFALRRISGFFVPSIIVADLLGNTWLLARVQKVTVCDSWLVDFDPFCLFRVSRFVVLWWSSFGQ